MRNFHNAAIAGTTALALTFGGTAVAGAEETADNQTAADQTVGNQSASEQNQGGDKPRSSSTRIFESIGGDHSDPDTYMVNGRDLFGSSKNWDNVGTPAKVLYGLTVALGAVAAFGVILAPLDNFINYRPFAQ